MSDKICDKKGQSITVKNNTGVNTPPEEKVVSESVPEGTKSRTSKKRGRQSKNEEEKYFTGTNSGSRPAKKSKVKVSHFIKIKITVSAFQLKLEHEQSDVQFQQPSN